MFFIVLGVLAAKISLFVEHLRYEKQREILPNHQDSEITEERPTGVYAWRIPMNHHSDKLKHAENGVRPTDNAPREEDQHPNARPSSFGDNPRQ
jgi:hypothetical protein